MSIPIKQTRCKYMPLKAKQFLKNKIDYMIKEIDDCINNVMEK